MTSTRIIDLGEVAAKSTTLRSVSLTKPTLKVSTSCGCTATTVKGNQLIVSYTAPEIPKYKEILGQAKMQVSKTITILYTDSTKEIITLNAIVSA